MLKLQAYKRRFVAATVVCLALAACNPKDITPNYPKTREELENEKIGSLLDNRNILSIFGGNKKNIPEEAKLNPHLWEATVDSLHHLPLERIDPKGGMILTEWYSVPQHPSERFRISALVSGNLLKPEALKIVVFKQIKQHNIWVDVQTKTLLAEKISEQILLRALEIRAQGK